VKKLFIALSILILIVAGGGAALGFYVWNRIQAPYKGFSDPEKFVDIPTGTGTAEIRRRLVDAGVVSDEWAFRAALVWTGQSRALQAGEYRFDRPMSAAEVLDKIARGDVYRRLVTFREGLTIREMARVFEEAGLGKAADFEAAARNHEAVRAIDPAARDLEGYLFPETYTLRRDTQPAVLVDQMTGLFLKTFTPALQEAAKAQGLTARQAVTLASLVEKETAIAEERPLVAAVYLNRKKLGMPMQADPTVIYALQQGGRYSGNLRREDLQFDSPYNTYRYPGLPPGPIAAPGKASLEAAVNPAAVDYLYFVSRNDGSHVFARTLEEHNRNVQEWQIKFFRERRQGSR
jgi:peptidoglycan lytic transglycosylase G